MLFQPREPPAAAGCEPQTRQRPSEIVPEAQYGGTGRALEPPGQTGRPRPADEGCGSVPIRGTAPRLDVMEPGTKAEPIPVQRCGRPHQRLVRPDLLPLRAPRGQRQPRLTACGTAPLPEGCSRADRGAAAWTRPSIQRSIEHTRASGTSGDAATVVSLPSIVRKGTHRMRAIRWRSGSMAPPSHLSTAPGNDPQRPPPRLPAADGRRPRHLPAAGHRLTGRRPACAPAAS